ncbi:MAG: hypothetical protein EOP05_22765 [Proteobacteria bacterium]|nr:MAG: hypothetical protein EOP05_22765 [Pseudomonadota bacterium]
MSEENIQLARYLNLLFRYSNIESHQAAAKHAMKFLTIPEVAEDLYITCGVLQAASELERPPVHVTLLGSKKDEKAKILWPEALKFPLSYHRVDWWDKSEGPLPANDVSYPELSRPAVFTCTESRCSLPAFEISDIQKRIGNLTK